MGIQIALGRGGKPPINRIPCVGESAQHFKGEAFQGAVKVRVDLAKLRGRWVVLFFCPGDFTCMCPTEIAALAVKYPALLELGVEILAVSRLAAQARQISEIFSS